MIDINELLKPYGIEAKDIPREIDTSRGEQDQRLNVVIDERYVLRINSNTAISEERIAEVHSLAERYNAIGLHCPRCLQKTGGGYTVKHGDKICYLSEYIPEKLLNEVQVREDVRRQIRGEVLRSLGVFAKNNTGKFLCSSRSMWSIIDLAPLDADIDEKQENCNLLTEKLREHGREELACRVEEFNIRNRDAIRSVFEQLPRCVYQGDLNDSNILVKDGHFYGLIDFNMAGTEVNINCFLAETNSSRAGEIGNRPAEEVYNLMLAEQDAEMRVILENYDLNAVEKQVYENYRNVILISQYPNVMAWVDGMKKNCDRVYELIGMIVER